MIITGGAVAEYVAGRIGTVFEPPYTALGVAHEGCVVAGVVFNCWTGPDVQLSIAAEPGALSRRFLRRCGLYVTKELGCIRSTVITEQRAVVRLVERMGGKVEGTLRSHFGRGRDGVVVGILQEDWIF